MDIEQINPLNQPALAAWHATAVAADVHGREDTATPWQLPEVRAELLDQRDAVRLAFAGIEDGRTIVVSGQIRMSLRDNLQQADVEVFVHPSHRRRGHGTHMLEHLETVARGHGRTILNAEASWPYDGAADGAGSAGAEFLLDNGFRFGLGDVMRFLDLPVDDRLLDSLAAEVAPHHAAYELRSWAGRVPEQLEVGWADLESSLMVEAPVGDMERERESADVGELRRRQDTIEAQGRTLFKTVALDGKGWPVAYTTLVTGVHDPANAFQWGTLVRREHRGHRLGLAVKVANLRAFQATTPIAARLITWNAEVNVHMVGVNERLGFRPVERSGEFQKRL